MSGVPLKILKMRHASSDMNIISSSYSNTNIHIPFYKMSYTESLIDCDLSFQGKLEINSMSPILDKFGIKYIFTSPLRRAIETTRLLVETQKPKTIPKIRVEPDLREFLMNQSDIPYYYKKAMHNNLYSNFDFSEMISADRKQLWYIKDNTGEAFPEMKEYLDLLGILDPERKITDISLMVHVLNKMRGIFPKSIEPETMLRARIRNAFESISTFLSNEIYIRGEEIKDHEVLVITHYNIISAIHKDVTSEEGFMGSLDPTDITEMQLII